MDYAAVPTPASCYADFCLIPVYITYNHMLFLPQAMVLTRDFLSQVGTASVSVAAEVAEVQRLLKASGLKYTMHSAGTTVGKLSLLPKHLCCVSFFFFLFSFTCTPRIQLG
jgi:hypothetical protein